VNIIIIGTVVFFIRSLIFFVGAIIERKKSLPSNISYSPFVSVVVPARDEAENIASCIHSLLNSTYSSNNFEIIIVNDNSEDETVEIVQTLQKQHDHIRLVHTKSSSGGNLQGKTHAVHTGIEASKGELVLMTDADCTVDSRWVETAVRIFADESVGFVCSFTQVAANSLFEHLQNMEWIHNHTLASSGVGLHQPLGCFGNNICIRRTTYNDIGGYPNIPFSVTEDLALMQAVAKTQWHIRYVCLPSMKVTTKGHTNLQEFIHQHHRWARGGTGLGWRAMIFIVSSTAFWIGVVTAIVTQNWLGLGVLWLMRLCADTAIVALSLFSLRLYSHLVLMPVGVLFVSILELIFPFFMLKSSVSWKGRVFRA
jgi:cellulose synthase/poly-beta-1,6-N-acetylglucosamine synthase-like glycosyltransferase